MTDIIPLGTRVRYRGRLLTVFNRSTRGWARMFPGATMLDLIDPDTNEEFIGIAQSDVDIIGCREVYSEPRRPFPRLATVNGEHVA